MSNNPRIKINNSIIQTIGDVHLGKVFKTGVPNSRLSDRERLVVEDFKNLLNPEDPVDFIILMGDLFDKFIVYPHVINTASNLISQAAKNNPDIKYIIIPGNHDLSKDKTRVSSYFIFYKIFQNSNYPNLTVIYDKSKLLKVSADTYFYLDAYNPFHSSEEFDLPEEEFFKDTEGKTVASFGHWDDPRNEFGSYYPNDVLKEYSDLIVSGHIHTPAKFKYEGIQYYLTGSLQPYSHAEDPKGTWYQTIHYEDLEKLVENDDTKSLENKNIRISCYPGYVFPYEINCLSLIYFNNLVQETDSDCSQTDPESITDFSTLYLRALAQQDVSKEVLIKVNEFLKDTSEDVHFTLD